MSNAQHILGLRGGQAGPPCGPFFIQSRAGQPYTLEVTMATKKQVVEAWIDGRSAKTPNKSLRSDGENLWSYGLRIGYTVKGFLKIVKDYTSPAGNFVSVTTSNHVGLAKRYADKIVEAV